MKNSLNESTFILMCAHITTYNMLDKFGLFSNVFNDYNGTPYSDYTRRAKRKKLKFDLSLEDFNKSRNENPCYICGRYSNENHKNGIDRVDNNQGYSLNNCKSCCGDCNYLKREISHSKLIMKCMYIAANHKNKLSDLQEIWTPSKFGQINTNKLSKEEIDELKSQRKKRDMKKLFLQKLLKLSKQKWILSKEIARDLLILISEINHYY
nr:divergent HNH endonuclease [Mimivirus sp.]